MSNHSGLEHVEILRMTAWLEAEGTAQSGAVRSNAMRRTVALGRVLALELLLSVDEVALELLLDGVASAPST